MGADVLFDPYSPSNSRAITVGSWNDLSYDGSGDVLRVYGRRDPVAVTDARPLPSGALELVSLDLDEQQWLDSLLATGRIIGFRPGDDRFGLPAECLLYVGKVVQQRVVTRAGAPERRWKLDVQMVGDVLVGEGHAHSLDSLADVATAGAATGNVLGFDGTIWAPAAGLANILTAKGDILYHNGTSVVRLPAGLPGQVLTVDGTGLPRWSAPQ